MSHTESACIIPYLGVACVQVIVLEKGRFTPAAELPLTEQEAFRDMYEMGSLLTTQDAGMNIPVLVTCIVLLCVDAGNALKVGHTILTA